MQHTIDTGNAKQIKGQLRRIRFWQQQEIARQTKKLLELEIIFPCKSEWAANVLLVKKKGKTQRMVSTREL